MKKHIKQNNRNNALAGTTALLISSGIGALANIASSLIGAHSQKKQAEAAERASIMNNNNENMITAQNNEMQARNYNKQYELEFAKTNQLSTLNNAMKCGGKRRMKKSGGTVTSNINKLSKYI